MSIRSGQLSSLACRIAEKCNGHAPLNDTCSSNNNATSKTSARTVLFCMDSMVSSPEHAQRQSAHVWGETALPGKLTEAKPDTSQSTSSCVTMTSCRNRTPSVFKCRLVLHRDLHSLSRTFTIPYPSLPSELGENIPDLIVCHVFWNAGQHLAQGCLCGDQGSEMLRAPDESAT